jgi:hypothetical protein
MQMRTCPFKTRTRGSHSSLPLAAWSVRQATARASLSNQPLIEKTDRIDPKLPLSLRNSISYGPTTACPASTLWQTNEAENMRTNSANCILLRLFLVVPAPFSALLFPRDPGAAHGSLTGTVIDNTEAAIARACVTITKFRIQIEEGLCVLA